MHYKDVVAESHLHSRITSTNENGVWLSTSTPET